MSIAGTWQNEYGSIMTLTAVGSAISGIYRSSTGSVGEYEVVGFQVGGDATEKRGQPVALAIEWHSIGDDPADASWNWSSGLCGQISIQDDEEVLVLAHLLIASSEFAGLAAVGNYVDKLTYKRVTDDTINAPSHGGLNDAYALAAEDPLAGTWVSDDGITMTLEVIPAAENRFGRVSGAISFSNQKIAVAGFTDINATADGLALQSVAITTFDTSEILTVSLSGTLDLATGVLNLLNMRSGVTTPANSYTQTRISFARFTRQ